jgi:sulfur carrier protein
MKITVNGTLREVRGETLADILAECGFTGRVATAVNETFVPAASRADRRIAEGDRIEVLGAMQGG